MKTMLAGMLMVGLLTTTAAAEGDAELGENVFRKCKACHAVGENAKAKVGPVLNDIMGMQAGTHESFEGKYSAAMIEAGEGGLVWDEESVAAYLEKPKEMVPKTKMSFPGLKEEEDRANVVAYLKQFSPDYAGTE